MRLFFRRQHIHIVRNQELASSNDRRAPVRYKLGRTEIGLPLWITQLCRTQGNYRMLNRRKKSIGLVGLGLVLWLAVSVRNTDGFFPVINGMCENMTQCVNRSTRLMASQLNWFSLKHRAGFTEGKHHLVI